MTNVIQSLQKKNLIQPPKWLSDNCHYLTMMGSVAYGVSTDHSDVDIYGFCLPPLELVFPHLAGEIPGFGTQLKRFEQYQQHGINDPTALGNKGRVYDLTIYSIVKYFQLCLENNPNMIDSLFVPQDCVLHITAIGNMVRENRKLFLHKGCWFKLKGYAYSQLHKASSKDPIGKRKQLREEYGMDVKFLYHVVRLLYTAEMILEEGDLDLRRHNEHLKAIRRGDISEEEIRQWATEKEKNLERVYEASKLRHSPDEPKIKRLLLDCLEAHYGNLDKVRAYVEPDKATLALKEIQAILDRFN